MFSYAMFRRVMLCYVRMGYVKHFECGGWKT